MAPTYVRIMNLNNAHSARLLVYLGGRDNNLVSTKLWVVAIHDGGATADENKKPYSPATMRNSDPEMENTYDMFSHSTF